MIPPTGWLPNSPLCFATFCGGFFLHTLGLFAWNLALLPAEHCLHWQWEAETLVSWAKQKYPNRIKSWKGKVFERECLPPVKSSSSTEDFSWRTVLLGPMTTGRKSSVPSSWRMMMTYLPSLGEVVLFLLPSIRFWCDYLSCQPMRKKKLSGFFRCTLFAQRFWSNFVPFSFGGVHTCYREKLNAFQATSFMKVACLSME